ncbi:MAG: hypothetical protein LBJ11_09715 [Oscillospiraceae bacterium]|jgi:hypothetical protein|nr:hypothetical protein [Oscillospiraceae bacterium]
MASIDHGQAFDWGKTSAAYAQYRDIYPPELFERLLALGVGRGGEPLAGPWHGDGRRAAGYGAPWRGNHGGGSF